MVNLLGFRAEDTDYIDERQALVGLAGAALHWYGKQGSGLGRKLGHLTLSLDAAEPGERLAEAMVKLDLVRRIWPLPHGPENP